MSHNVHALGMFMRFVPQESTAQDFYENTIGLPLVRRVGKAANLYWGGEAVVFESMFIANKAVAPDADPASALCVPVFRVNGLDALVGRLTAKGVTVTPVATRGASREAHFIDTDGHLVGLRERTATATSAFDVEARRRHRRGEAYNPGCKPMPDGVQELGWIVRRVADLPMMLAFYRDVLELTALPDEDGRHLFDLGDNILLEVTGGGRTSPFATDRSQAHNVMLLRVSDLNRLRTKVAAAGLPVVNDRVTLHWADLAYLTDPEGTVFGAEQGYHPGTYAPEKFLLPENLEAERRWREKQGSM